MGESLTAGDLALIENRRGYGYGYEGGCGYHHGRGMAATGIGLAAGLGGAALVGVAALAFGLNAASKARLRAAENASAGNTKAIEYVAGVLAQERGSRETWQNQHAPSISQYVDVRTGAGSYAGAGANALAQAEALSLLANGGFGNNRSGQVCPQPVALYQPAMPCRCNTCGD